MRHTILFIFSLLIFNFLNAQTTGDYRTKQTGNWSDPNTWEVYDGSNWNPATTPPDTNANQVTIQANHTISFDQNSSIKNLLVEANGVLQYSATNDTLTIYGDLINNGKIDFYKNSSQNVVLQFAGDKTSNFTTGTATTDIHQILVNKDSIIDSVLFSADDNFTIHGRTSNAASFLKLKGGTFVLGGTVTINSYTLIRRTSSYITINSNSGFWLNNPNFTIKGQSRHLEVYGTLHISDGTFNVGSSQNKSLRIRNHGKFIQDGGTLNIQGAFYSTSNDTVQLTINDGTINIALQPVTTDYYYCFRIGNAASTFTMTGGIINIINTNENVSSYEYRVASDLANTNITGGVVNIGTSATPENDTFRIGGPLPNTVVDNTNYTKVAQINGNVYIFGDLTIKDGSKLIIRPPDNNGHSYKLYTYGDIIADGDIDGIIKKGTEESHLTLYLKGNNNTQITGNADTVELYQLFVDKGTDKTPTAEILRTIILDSADADDNSRLYIYNGTLKISASNHWYPYFGSSSSSLLYVNSETGRLWLNNNDIIIGFANDLGSLRFNGDLYMENGQIIVPKNMTINSTSTGNNYMNNGTINAGGNFYLRAALTVNNGTITAGQNFYINGGNDNEHGQLVLNNGTINIGDGNDKLSLTGGTGNNGLGAKLTVHGGTINIFGSFQTSNGTGTEISRFTMDGGQMNIDPQATTNLDSNEHIFYVRYNSIVNFTGGTVTIVDPQAKKDASYRYAINIRGTTDNKNFTGSTFRLGDGSSSASGDPNYPGFVIYVQNNIKLGTIICDNPSGDNRQVILRTNLYAKNLILNTSHDLFVLNGKDLYISGNIVNNGTIDGTASGSLLEFNGSTAQTYSGSGSIADYLQELTFNNSGDGVTLDADLGALKVNLVNGKVFTSSQGNGLLTVYGTSPNSLTGGNASIYVQSYLRRAIPSDANSEEFEFPIGSASGFRLLKLSDITTSGSDFGLITAYVSEPQNPTVNGSAGTGLKDPLNTKDIYWKLSFDLNNVSFSSTPIVKLLYNASGLPPFCIAQSNNDINGTYNSIGRKINGDTIESTSFDLNSNGGLQPTGDAYLVIAQVQPIEGVVTVGNSGDVLNLTEIADTLAKNYIKGYVIFELQDDYDASTETIPVVFDTIMKVSPSDAVVIRPASGVSGTQTALSSSGPLIILDSINSIRFDGRPGGSGSSDWLFANTNSDIVFEFRNGANHDTLSYLTIKSDIQTPDAGIITFAGTSNNTGNNDNVVMNCDITGYSSTMTNGIVSSGTATAPNDSNEVLNCNIYDFFKSDGNPHGIYLIDGSNYWTIANNRFYQTAARSFSQDQFYVPIMISTGYGHTIDGNIIGYADNSGSGKTQISGAASQFAGIWLNTTSGASTTVINNVIDGIDFTTNYGGSDECGVFSGIYIDDNSDGSFVIGSAGNGNIIGNTSTQSSISLKHSNNGQVFGIKVNNNGQAQVSYNTISGITQTTNNSDDVKYFTGIALFGSGDKTVSYNTIGSNSLANSIVVGEDGVTTERNYVYGINSNIDNPGLAIINHNTIANLTSYSSSDGGYVIGINIFYGESRIEYNKIFNLKANNKYPGNIARPNVGGIYKNTAFQSVIRGNEIYSLGNEYDGNVSLRVAGITDATSNDYTDTIEANFIHNLYCSSNNDDGIIYGIVLHYGNGFVANNMVDLGYDPSGNDLSNPLELIGLYDYTPGRSDYYHNSIFIGGSNVQNGYEQTFCLYKSGTNYTHIYNNLFINKRSNSSSSNDNAHFAVRYDNKEVAFSDYNIYLANGTGGYLANIAGVTLTTLRDIKVFTGKDYHSGVGDPKFVNETGDAANCDLHIDGSIASPVEGTGFYIAQVKTDFDGQNRADYSPVDIGADAGNFTFDASVDIFTPNFQYTPIEPQNCGVTSVTIDVRITDQGTGLPTSGSYLPRIYYRDKSLSWSSSSSVQGSLVSGDGNDGIWRFTLTGLQNGKFYEYYVVAQDQADVPNIGYSKFDENTPLHSDVNNVINYPDDNVEIDAFTVCVYPRSTYYVGNFSDCPTCDFATLTDYDDFFYNMDAMIIDKDVTCYIAANTNEPGNYGLKQLKYKNGSHIIYIKPVDTTTVVKQIVAESDVNKSLIRFNGGDSIKIDGYTDNIPRALRFIHKKDDQAVIHFVNDAQHDTVANCDLIGVNRIDPRGIVLFDTTNVSGGSGNSYNVLYNNYISNDTLGEPPLNAIYSLGSTDRPNSNNQIIQNIIANFKENAIWITKTGNGDNWTISHNSIFNYYETDSLRSIINIQAGGGHIINSNRIGGKNIDNRGGFMTSTKYLNDFSGIRLSVDENKASTVTGNRIQNLSTPYNGSTLNLYGIEVDSGKVNITNNQIDSLLSNRYGNTYGIYYYGVSGAQIENNTIKHIVKNHADIKGIYIESTSGNDTFLIKNNAFLGFDLQSNTSGSDLIAIHLAKGNAIIDSNTIGGPNPSDSTNYFGQGNFTGIYVYTSDFGGQINYNTIQNVYAPNSVRFRGIYIRNCDDHTPIDIKGNKFDDLTFAATDKAAILYIRDGSVNIDSNLIGLDSGITQLDTIPLYAIYANVGSENLTIDSNLIQKLDAKSITAIFGQTSTNYNATISHNKILNITSDSITQFTGITIGDVDTINLDSNTIADINLPNENSSFTGIQIQGGNVVNIGQNLPNLIGSTSDADNISIAGPTLKAINLENPTGITNLKNNIIANITQNNNASTAYLSAIYSDNDGQKLIYGNQIFNLKSSSQKTDISDGLFPIQGIFINGNSTAAVDSNIIHDLNSTSSTAVNVAAITENSETATITKNRIYNILNSSGGNAVGISLYKLNSGYVANNMISLGSNDATTYIGLWIPQDNSNTKNIYFNSIYIGGNATGGNSYAFLRENNSTPLNIKNNIFANFRSGGSGKHYAIATKNTSDWTRTYADANDYFSSSSTTIALWGNTDCDFDTWINHTGENDYHLSTDAQPSFVDPSIADLHLSDYSNACAFNYVGHAIAGITTDFDNQTRDANHPDIGADEFDPTGRSGPFVWRGWNNSNWDNTGNWQCQVVPSNTTEDVIVYNMNNDPVIDRNDMSNPVVINALNIYPDATLTVMPKSAITINGNLTLNGTIILDDISEYDTLGSLIDNGTISGSGRLIARKLLGKKHWHEVASPIANATSAVFTRSNPTGNFNPNFYYYDETTDLDGNSSTEPSGSFNSNYLAAGWKYAHNGQSGSDVSLNPAQGYIFWTDVNQFVVFNGTPNTGDYTVSLSYTPNDPDDDGDVLPDLYDGWNFLGNPYPSYLDWEKINDNLPSGVDDAIYVWDNDQYAGYVNGSRVMSGNLGNLIPPMQGFFIHVNANTSITLSNSDRSHGNQRYLKSMPESQMPDYLKFKLSANGYDDLMAIRFLDDATEEYDGKFDALRMFTSNQYVPQLFALTKTKHNPLALSALPTSSLPNRTVQLGINIGKPSQCELSTVYFNGFDSINVWLEDRQVDSLINLRRVHKYEFSFNGGDDRQRFVLHFGLNHPPVFNFHDTIQVTAYLPVDFDYSNLFSDNDTTDQINVEIVDSLNFVQIDSMVLHIQPTSQDIGIHVFRLKAQDLIGATTIGNIPIEVLPNHSPICKLDFDRVFVPVGQEYVLNLDSIFTDPDAGDRVIVNIWVSPNSWIMYDSINNRLIGTPHENDTTAIVQLSGTDLANNQTVKTISFIPEQSSKHRFRVYPNPTNDLVHIDLPMQQAKIRLWSPSGQLLMQKQINDGQTINLRDLAAGSYILEVIGHKELKAKIIKH